MVGNVARTCQQQILKSEFKIFYFIPTNKKKNKIKKHFFPNKTFSLPGDCLQVEASGHHSDGRVRI